MGMTSKEYHEGYQQGYKDAKEEFKNTILKYQKIEQIYKEWFSDAGHTSAEAYGRIGEVLEDGNVD